MAVNMLDSLKKTQKLINETENEKWLGFYYGRFFTGSITLARKASMGPCIF